MNDKASILVALGARQCEKCRELLFAENQRMCDTCAGSPREIFDALVARAAWLMVSGGFVRHDQPGKLIEQLSPEKRRSLEGLTSADVNDVRADFCKLTR